jgi:hypothetical protein
LHGKRKVALITQTIATSGGFAGGLHGRHQQAHQNADDRNDDQKLDERKGGSRRDWGLGIRD